MKRSTKKTVIAAAVSLLLLFAMTLSVFAASDNLQNWEKVLVGGINIVLNGESLNQNDGESNSVEPIVYNGNAYLPVSAIPSLLDINAEYDEATKTIYIGQAPISGYVWVLNKTDINVTEEFSYPETYIYSYGDKQEGKEWLIFNFRWASGEEYTNADVYYGCDAPPAAIKAGENLSMEMAVKVKNFDGWKYNNSPWVPVSGTYITAGYGYDSKLSDENGEEFLVSAPQKDGAVLGNMEKYFTVSGTVPKSENVGDEMQISYHCDAGIITWHYTLQYND